MKNNHEEIREELRLEIKRILPIYDIIYSCNIDLVDFQFILDEYNPDVIAEELTNLMNEGIIGKREDGSYYLEEKR